MYRIRDALFSIPAFITLGLICAPVAAQYPPGGIPGAGQPGPGVAQPPNQGVRVDRLEARIRELTGQIEELQFKMQRMEQQLQKFQQDVDYRLQERGNAGAPPAAPAARAQPQRRSEIAPPVQVQPDVPVDNPMDDNQPAVIPAPAGATPGNAAPPAGSPQRMARRGDAFNPEGNPAAAGAPRPLAGQQGAYVPSAPRRLPAGPLDPETPPDPGFDDDPNAPLDLNRPTQRGPAPARPGSAPASTVVVPNYPGVLPGVPGQAMPGQAAPGQAGQPPGAAPQQPQNKYQVAVAALKENRLDDAEQDFRAFIDQNPKSRSIPDALFNLGMIYEKRGRQREAAEQYLKVTQAHEKASRAPESMLRLGLALEKLGAREQACATWQEAGRKYPLAPNYVRTGLERNLKRASCA